MKVKGVKILKNLKTFWIYVVQRTRYNGVKNFVDEDGH
jgi:hypothetical protein